MPVRVAGSVPALGVGERECSRGWLGAVYGGGDAVQFFSQGASDVVDIEGEAVEGGGLPDGGEGEGGHIVAEVAVCVGDAAMEFFAYLVGERGGFVHSGFLSAGWCLV